MRWLLLAAIGVFAAGCGPDCLTTCQRLHADGVDAQGENQCNITVPGMEAAQLIRECSASCERAMARAGTLDGYDPNKRTPPSEAQELVNDRQAAAWMDCVAETSCENLGDGYCAPTSNYGSNQ